ncbi:MAG: metallophosphoesterase [Bacteroidales bacterium]|nr:metallophosphoesterase [Bacteroidales bacterium]
MKKNLPLNLIGLMVIIICLFTSCEKENIKVFDIFNTDSETRNLIVVISDLHLGADISYSEINNNLEPLKEFLEQIRVSRNVKELVIAGDMLDEWYIPATTNTYNGKDQADFVNRISITNKGVIDKFNQIIQGNKILVTYIPGNHDLAITSENVERILPGINQARDARGVGTYSPSGYPEIAIEHGHRYNFICAPDPISNQDVAPGTILPPGYFFTRYAVQHVIQSCTQSTDIPPTITPNISGEESQMLLYGYWSIWMWWVNQFPIENHFNEKMIITNVDGFTDTYSVDDLIPFQKTQGGLIQVKLFNGIQNSWAERCIQNNVAVPIPTSYAFKFAGSSTGTDTMAVIQYFMNPNSNKRIVVFGHTHNSKIEALKTHNEKKAIYANSGTWIDHNLNGGTTMNFIIITPQNDNITSQTYVKLYNFENKVVTEMANDSLRL